MLPPSIGEQPWTNLDKRPSTVGSMGEMPEPTMPRKTSSFSASAPDTSHTLRVSASRGLAWRNAGFSDGSGTGGVAGVSGGFVPIEFTSANRSTCGAVGLLSP